MLSFNSMTSPFNRSSVAPDYDEEKDFGVFVNQRPSEVRSNLDRFRLMVGITTAPSMQSNSNRMSTTSRLVQSVLTRNDPSRGNSVLRPEPAHVGPGGPNPSVGHAGDATNTASILSSNGPRKERSEFDVPTEPTRTVANKGIYEIVCVKGSRARMSYKYASFLINICLGLQIIVAAALTALGAASHSGRSVTALGAINTVIAGFLTYLKGSGLPGKLKYFQHEWDKIRDYIEARERDLRVNDNAFDVNEQVDYVRYIFEQVKQDIDSNRADRFTSSGALHTLSSETSEPQRMQKKKLVELGKSMVSELKDAYHEHSEAANNQRQSIQRQVSGQAHQIQRQVSGQGHQIQQQLNEQGQAIQRTLTDKHVGVRDAVRALSAEADEIKKRLHDSGDLENFLHRILDHKSVEKRPEDHAEK